MNIEDRAALYAEAHRVLGPGGRLAIHDVVLRGGDVVYPVPWARDASSSFLRSDADTRAAIEHAGFRPVHWRDETQAAGEWFAAMVAAGPTGALNLGVVMGPDFAMLVRNLGQNLRDGRLGVVSAVFERA
jgi:hypothetical protein